MPGSVAKIAVAAAKYWVDRPYDYLIPEELREKALPGSRVYVPFARGNRRSEGIILAVSDHSDYKRLKAITAVLDEKPVLTPEQIKLALFMRERFFCTVFDAVKAMLPAGLWFNSEGRRRVGDKTLEMVKLCLSPEEASAIAANKRGRSPQQANILELLCSFESLPSKELLHFTGASRQSLKALQNSGLVELYSREAFRRPEIHVGEPEPLPELNEEQQKAYEGINALACSGKSGAALLFGVTGSGKTSVYIHLIMEQLRRGKSAILLVPEIALTPQMIQTFSSHFGDDVAVLHSSLSLGERYDEWKRIKSGKARLAIGTRSAVFAPVDKLGIIIIDEEQEETYKSENSPRYNARDIAKFRCAGAGALLLLGSATPDIVSMYKAQSGAYAYFQLKNRFNDMTLPDVEIVDMKRELRRGNGGNISSRLREELEDNLARGEQSILFINRRGANKLISCGECGFTYKCPKCSVSLTYHSNKELFAQKVVSDFTLKTAENNFLTAQAGLAQAEAQEVNARNNLSYTVVKSPSEGVVGTLPYRVGALVSANIPQPLTTVSDNSTMYVYFSMTENQLLSLVRQYRTLDSALVQMPDLQLQLNDQSLYEEKGRIESISGVIDRQTGTVSVRAVFPNGSRLLHSGASGSVLIPSTYEDCIAIPQEATVKQQDKVLVYKVVDGKAVSTLITVADVDDGRTYIVTGGLTVGDEIVAKGAGLVREGMQVK